MLKYSQKRERLKERSFDKLIIFLEQYTKTMNTREKYQNTKY